MIMAGKWKYEDLKPIPVPQVPKNNIPSGPSSKIVHAVTQDHYDAKHRRAFCHGPNIFRKPDHEPWHYTQESYPTAGFLLWEQSVTLNHRSTAYSIPTLTARKHNITYALRTSDTDPSDEERDYLLATPLHIYQIEQASISRLKTDLLASIMADIEQRIMLPVLYKTAKRRTGILASSHEVHRFVEYACGCFADDSPRRFVRQETARCAHKGVARAEIRHLGEVCAVHASEN